MFNLSLKHLILFFFFFAVSIFRWPWLSPTCVQIRCLLITARCLALIC
jgi:hypothetical protein